MRVSVAARVVAAIAFACSAAACKAGGAGAPCIRNSDCTYGLTCVPAGTCVEVPDAADGDGGLPGDATSIPDLPDADIDAPVDATSDAPVDADLAVPDAGPDIDAI